MADDESVVHLEKSGPVLLLENRRLHLISWIGDGEATIAAAEQTIKQAKVAAIEMAVEIDEIEKALNLLGKAPKESTDA